MEIIKRDRELIPFSEIKYGECFSQYGELYFKIEPVLDDSGYVYNAAVLNTGELANFEATESVLQANVQLVWQK